MWVPCTEEPLYCSGSGGCSHAPVVLTSIRVTHFTHSNPRLARHHQAHRRAVTVRQPLAAHVRREQQSFRVPEPETAVVPRRRSNRDARRRGLGTRSRQQFPEPHAPPCLRRVPSPGTVKHHGLLFRARHVVVADGLRSVDRAVYRERPRLAVDRFEPVVQPRRGGEGVARKVARSVGAGEALRLRDAGHAVDPRPDLPQHRTCESQPLPAAAPSAAPPSSAGAAVSGSAPGATRSSAR